MKTARYLFLAVFTIVSLPQQVFAWGKVGHAIIANVAEAQLTPAARAEVARLLAVEGDKHLSDISSWADHVKGRPESPVHSIRMPLNGPVDPNACPRNYCIVAGIENYQKILENKAMPIAQREIALKYIVHLVGDIHQPLHCVEWKNSSIPVIFHGKRRTLHQVWDSGIIGDHPVGERKITAELLANGRGELSGDPMGWATESRDMARDVILTRVHPGSATPITLPDDYGVRNWPFVVQRLTQAGGRLANLLNQSLR